MTTQIPGKSDPFHVKGFDGFTSLSEAAVPVMNEGNMRAVLDTRGRC